MSRRRISSAVPRQSDAQPTLCLYFAAALAYTVLGVLVTEVLLSWPVGVAFLILFVHGVPWLYRRLR
jgi:hypothetical protein